MPEVTAQERFLTLLEEHKKLLYKVASAYGRTPADRADLVQEMTAQLWRSFERYDARQRFSTWAYRVALNVAISFYRGESRRSRHLVPSEGALLEVAAEPEAPDERLAQLHAVIQQLHELDRALVILYLDGHRYDTIADILGLSESNVGTRLSRLRQQLRRDLAHTAS